MRKGPGEENSKLPGVTKVGDPIESLGKDPKIEEGRTLSPEMQVRMKAQDDFAKLIHKLGLDDSYFQEEGGEKKQELKRLLQNLYGNESTLTKDEIFQGLDTNPYGRRLFEYLNSSQIATVCGNNVRSTLEVGRSLEDWILTGWEQDFDKLYAKINKDNTDDLIEEDLLIDFLVNNVWGILCSSFSMNQDSKNLRNRKDEIFKRTHQVIKYASKKPLFQQRLISSFHNKKDFMSSLIILGRINDIRFCRELDIVNGLNLWMIRSPLMFMNRYNGIVYHFFSEPVIAREFWSMYEKRYSEELEDVKNPISQHVLTWWNDLAEERSDLPEFVIRLQKEESLLKASQKGDSDEIIGSDNKTPITRKKPKESIETPSLPPETKQSIFEGSVMLDNIPPGAKVYMRIATTNKKENQKLGHLQKIELTQNDDGVCTLPEITWSSISVKGNMVQCAFWYEIDKKKSPLSVPTSIDIQEISRFKNEVKRLKMMAKDSASNTTQEAVQEVIKEKPQSLPTTQASQDSTVETSDAVAETIKDDEGETESDQGVQEDLEQELKEHIWTILEDCKSSLIKHGLYDFEKGTVSFCLLADMFEALDVQYNGTLDIQVVGTDIHTELPLIKESKEVIFEIAERIKTKAIKEKKKSDEQEKAEKRSSVFKALRDAMPLVKGVDVERFKESNYIYNGTDHFMWNQVSIQPQVQRILDSFKEKAAQEGYTLVYRYNERLEWIRLRKKGAQDTNVIDVHFLTASDADDTSGRLDITVQHEDQRSQDPDIKPHMFKLGQCLVKALGKELSDVLAGKQFAKHIEDSRDFLKDENKRKKLQSHANGFNTKLQKKWSRKDCKLAVSFFEDVDVDGQQLKLEHLQSDNMGAEIQRVKGQYGRNVFVGVLYERPHYDFKDTRKQGYLTLSEDTIFAHYEEMKEKKSRRMILVGRACETLFSGSEGSQGRSPFKKGSRAEKALIEWRDQYEKTNDCVLGEQDLLNDDTALELVEFFGSYEYFLNPKKIEGLERSIELLKQRSDQESVDQRIEYETELEQAKEQKEKGIPLQFNDYLIVTPETHQKLLSEYQAKS